MNEKEAREILNWPKSTVDELYAKAESYLEVREKARVLEAALELCLTDGEPCPACYQIHDQKGCANCNGCGQVSLNIHEIMIKALARFRETI